VGPRAGLDGCGKSHSHPDLIPGPSSPQRDVIPTDLYRPMILTGMYGNLPVVSDSPIQSFGLHFVSGIVSQRLRKWQRGRKFLQNTAAEILEGITCRECQDDLQLHHERKAPWS
jgi:hypothetical protein